MWLPPEYIDEVKNNNPIEDVMADYVKLGKSNGRTTMCLCPFHSEKNPSCGVNIAEQYFNCFTCHVGGNVITFIQKIERLDFPEAVAFLAKRAGMPLPEIEDEKTKLRRLILTINREAAKYFNFILAKSPLGAKGRAYFNERQLSPATITNFGLGFAPYGDGLQNHLLSKGFSYDDMIAARLVSVSQKTGEIYSFFGGRVIFPIISEAGEVIGFGGRIIGDGKPKYKNSAENIVYTKRDSLFALNFAKKSGYKYLILAEGYMDVIALHQAGFTNAIAALGTAFTEEQARRIKKHFSEVLISYDSDAAGQNSTDKVISLLSAVGVTTKILKLHDAKDPDEYIKKFGALKLKLLIEKSEDSVEFKLKRARDGLSLEIPNDKAEYIGKAIEIFCDIKSDILRGIHATNLANECNLPVDSILREVEKKLKRKENAYRKKKESDIQNFKSDSKDDPKINDYYREYRAECSIINYLYRYPENIQNVANILDPAVFVTDLNRKVYCLAVKMSHLSHNFELMSVQSELSTEEMGKITEIIRKNSTITINDEILSDCIKILYDNYNRISDKREISNEEFVNNIIKLNKSKM